jgi:pimeloyl-ACP methyl ester carboxylesterase
MSAYENTRLSAGLLLAGFVGFGLGFIELRLNAQPTAEITWNGEFAVVTIRGTEAGKNYQMLSKPDLVSGPWVLEQDVGGAEGQDWTQTTVPMEGRPTLYMIAGYGEDSDGDGLSDVYEVLVTRTSPDSPDTGNTGISDTYKDSDGDEWTNLDEYRLRTDPLKFDPPRAPTNVRATMEQGATMATVRWDPLDGAVLEYIVEREIVPWSGQYEEIGRVAGNQVTFVDSQADPYKLYRVAGRYQPGNSSFSQNVRVNQADVRLAPAAAAIIRGPQGQLYLAVSALPQVAASLRISRNAMTASYPLFDYDPNFSPSSYFPENRVFPNDPSSAIIEIPVSELSNGVYPIPTSFAPDFGRYRFSLEVITAAGAAGEALSLASSRSAFNVYQQNKIPFLDGAAHLKQNLMFWLKAANASETFRYSIDADAFDSVPSYYSFACNPNYAYVDFHRRDGQWNRPFPDNEMVLDEFRPFQENLFLRNWIYQPNHLDSSNNINTGVGYDWWQGGYDWHSRESIFNERYVFPVYNYVTTSNQTLLQPVLSAADTQWIYHADLAWPETWDDPRIGVTRSGGNLLLASGLRNVFGLVYISLKIGSDHAPYPISTVFHGRQYSDAGFTYFGSTFQEVEDPVLQTESYYFAGSGDPMPGDPSWDVNNQTPLLIAPAGQLFTVVGWAKQRIVNGYTNKFAYLGQYFDKAFKVDPTTGQRTAQETGLLSEYGEFFPTEPGRVILTTKPDADQGNLQGECLIHVIKLQLDVNHDGEMDLSLAGPDNTSQARSYVFWINNDRDEPETSTKPELDLESYANRPDSQDWYQGHIRSKRNLEDFARLWICGLPTFPDSHGYTVELSIAASTGNPAINLYAAFDPGTGYLTDTNAAHRQFAGHFLNGQLVFDYARKLKTIASGQSYKLPISAITGQSLYTHFLFEAAGKGSGQLVLTVYQGTNTIARTSAWLDLRDIKELYEITVVSNVQQHWPEMVQENRVSGFQVLHSPDPTLNTAEEMVIFVHGWRMSEWGFLNFSETLFKRLYWQGFQGRFATLGWPTRSADTDPFFHLDFATYNRSEYVAFKSASGTAAYLNHLRNRFPDYTISVCAHSMGNIVMMETLKQLADQGKAPIDNYVLMEAAVPAQCYDPTVANLPTLMDTEQKVPTPDTYRNYAAGITRALRGGGRLVNFFNRLDFALNTWVVNQNLHVPHTNGPVTMKPNTFLGYYTDGTNNLLRTNSWNQDFLSILYGGYYDGPSRAVTNLLEVMPFVSRPRGLTVGAQGGTRGMVSAELNLETQLGFSDKSYDHSGQFNRNIQEQQVGPFYFQLKRNLLRLAP